MVTIAVVATALSVRLAALAARSGGRPDAATTAALAERTALLVGPATGLVTTFLGGWWSARGMTGDAVRQGALVGVIVAVLGLVLEAASGHLSGLAVLGRVLEVAAGMLGGFVAARRSQPSTRAEQSAAELP